MASTEDATGGSAVTAETAVTDGEAVTAEEPLAIRERRRLYVGNLPYKVTEEAVRAFFGAFDVELVSIPVHAYSGRNSGFGFVDLTSADAAERAIRELSGQPLEERNLFCQLARSAADRLSARTARRGSARGRGGRVAGKQRVAKDGDGLAGGATAVAPSSAARPEDPSPGGYATDAAGVSGDTQATGHVPGTADSANAAAAADKPAKARKPARPAKKGPPADGVPSLTTIFVANLKYSCTSDKLREAFAAYDPVSVQIALRAIPKFVRDRLAERGEEPKCRGFGFVTFADEAAQRRAIAEMDGKLVDGRNIAIRVAVDSPPAAKRAAGGADAAAKADGLAGDDLAEPASAERSPVSSAAPTTAPSAAPTAATTPASASAPASPTEDAGKVGTAGDVAPGGVAVQATA
ncbi:uncharacterized protein V1510DRAFT_179918 [Dipodascopsis tothii]|uniref:uncharacterized protein n=1 Tax=Dipodascopsis tothii TaxID=44089 RepID=UPI0034CE13EE